MPLHLLRESHMVLTCLTECMQQWMADSFYDGCINPNEPTNLVGLFVISFFYFLREAFRAALFFRIADGAYLMYSGTGKLF